MLSGQQYKFADTISKLTTEINMCDFKITETKKQQDKVAQLELLLSVMEEELANCEYDMREMKTLITDVTEYISIRRNKAINSLRLAVQVSNSIIPEATGGVDVAIDGDELELITADDLDLNLMEGSGFRALLSVLLRISVLRQNPNFLTNVFLDEAFSKVSAVKSSDVAMYFATLAKDNPITLIEHKKEIQQPQPGSQVYRFNLVDGERTVLERETY